MFRFSCVGVLFLSIISNVSQGMTPEQKYCLAVSPDGKLVAANLGGAAGIEVFDLATQKSVARLETATEEGVNEREKALPSILARSWVRQIKFSSSGKFLCCTTLDQISAAIIWNTEHFDKPVFIQSHQSAYCDEIVFSVDSNRLITFMHASPNGDDFLVAWDTRTGAEIWRRNLGADKVRHVRFSAKGDIAVLENADGSSSQQDPETGNPILPNNENAIVGTLPGESVQVETRGNQLRFIRIGLSKETIVRTQGDIRAVQLASANMVVVEVNLGLQVWEIDSGKLLFNLGNPDVSPPAPLFGNKSP